MTGRSRGGMGVGIVDDVRGKETDLLILPVLAEFFKQETMKTYGMSS